jgi:hypothetical protein
LGFWVFLTVFGRGFFPLLGFWRKSVQIFRPNFRPKRLLTVFGRGFFPLLVVFGTF